MPRQEHIRLLQFDAYGTVKPISPPREWYKFYDIIDKTGWVGVKVGEKLEWEHVVVIPPTNKIHINYKNKILCGRSSISVNKISVRYVIDTEKYSYGKIHFAVANCMKCRRAFMKIIEQDIQRMVDYSSEARAAWRIKTEAKCFQQRF